MKIKHDKHIAKVLGVMSAAALSGSLMASAPVNADTADIQAYENWVTPISIGITSTDMDFGQVLTSFADSGVNSLTMDSEGTLSGDTNYSLDGTGTPGEVTINSGAGQIITVSISSSSTASNGFSIGSFTCLYNGVFSGDCGSGDSFTATSAAGDAALVIGATINGETGSTLLDGDQTNETLTIDVAYQ